VTTATLAIQTRPVQSEGDLAFEAPDIEPEHLAAPSAAWPSRPLHTVSGHEPRDRGAARV